MKALTNLTFGEGVTILSEKQMKSLKGGNWYCHCNNDSSSIPVGNCSDCHFHCNNWYTCDEVYRG